MNNKTTIFIFISIFIGVCIGCNANKTSCKRFFKVQDAYYQTWIKNENEKGTNINIIVKNLQPNVEFDSIIFRGLQLPVHIENKENKAVLSATILSVIPEINNSEIPVSKPDQLLFKINGERHCFLLKKIRREKMEYYKY